MTKRTDKFKICVSYILVLFMLLSQPCGVFAENLNGIENTIADPNTVFIPAEEENVMSLEDETKVEEADKDTQDQSESGVSVTDEIASETETESAENVSADAEEVNDEAEVTEEAEESVSEDEAVLEEDEEASLMADEVNQFEMDPTCARVYQNTGVKEFNVASTIIGYIRLNADKTATYMSATGASASNPLSVSRSIIVPRRVIVSTYNGSLPDYKGKPCVYDYSDSGYDLDSEGYAIDHETKTRIQVKGEDDKMVDLYMGTEYTITALGEDCFKNEQCKLAQKITIPNTITSDITVDFFSDCISCASISVDRKSEDEGLTEGVNRYISGRKNGKNNEEVSQLNVLVDQKPNISIDGIGNVENYVIWCPPKFGANTYEIAWEENIAIGPKAFKNCKNLKSVTTSSNTPVVYFIGESAFEGCESLINVDRLTKNEKLKYIADKAFYGCISLKNVSFWETSVSGTRLGDYVFYDTPITSLEFPYGYHDMRGATFYGMRNLAKFNVKEYDDYENEMFIDVDDCLYRYEDPANKEDSKLELVCHPAMKSEPENTFRLSYNVSRIDAYSISNCMSLTKLIFPSTIYELDKDAIKECGNLRNLYFYSGLPELTATDSDEIFEGCISSIPKKLTVYAGYNTKIYNYCDKKGYTTMALYSDDWFEFSAPDADGNVTITKFSYASIDQDHKDVYPDIVVPDFILVDGVKCFVNGIGENVFAEPNITSVMFLNHLENVDANAFRIVPDVDDSSKDINAEKLEEIIVEDGNPFLTTEDGVLYAKELKKGSKTEYLITDLLYYPVGNPMTTYTTKDGLISLPENAFRGASNLRYINIYDSILTIGKINNTTTNEPAAFAGCKNLVKVNIIHKDGVKDEDITYASDDGVLYEYESGTYIRLLYYPKARRIMDGDNSSAMAYKVVRGCKEIVDMKDCQYLMSVSFPDTVEIIDDEALSNCTALSTVIFEKGSSNNVGIKKIGEKAFYQSRIRSLYIPGSIQSIGYCAFYLCPQLAEVKIDGDKLQYIGKRCFYDNPALKSVVISGTQKNESGDMVTLDTKAFAECPNLASVQVTNMESVTIEDSVFYNDVSLSDVSFYSSIVDTIGISAFEGDCSIETIDLGDSSLLTEIQEDAFLDCTSLNQVILPSGIRTLGDRVFKNCNKLMYINFDNLTSLETIGEECFYGCFFTKAVFTKRIRTIGDGAFDNNPMLCVLYIPETLVGDYTSGNPFRGYGKELFVYGVAGSSVEAFINSLGENGPTFVAGNIPYALVTVDPTSKQLFDRGDTTTVITAYVTSDESIDTSVKWVGDNNEVANLTDLGGAEGTYQLRVNAKKHGVVKIYAINRATGEMACSTISYRESGIELSPAPNTGSATSYKKGDSTYLTYNIKMNTKGLYKQIDLNGSSIPARQVYYRSENPSVAKVDANGRITAKKPGVATIICYAGKKENNTYAETVATVTVYAPTIKLNQKKVSLNRDYELSDNEEVFYTTNTETTLSVTTEGASNDVTWTTSDKNVVYFIPRSTTNSSAVIHAGRRSGTATITATCNGIKTTCKVTVLPTTLMLNKSNIIKLYSGGSKTDSIALKATVNGVDKRPIWSSDREDIAVVSATGVVSAIASGKATISVTANGLRRSCRVEVTDCTTKIAEIRPEAVVEIKEIYMDCKGPNRVKRLKAKVDGRSNKVSWISSYKPCATVNKNGVLTAKSGGDIQVYAVANGVEAEIDVHIASTNIELDEPLKYLYMDSDAKGVLLHADVCGTDKNRTIKWEIPAAYQNIIKLRRASTTSSTEELNETTTTDTTNKSGWSDGYSGSGEVKVLPKKKGKAKVNVTANGITKTYTIVVK